MYAFQPIAFSRVEAATCPPNFGLISSEFSFVDQVISLDFAAYNNGCTATSWSATGLPTGLSINTSTGLISGICGSVGSFTPNVVATNSAGSDSASFNWTVSL